jgi:hypothetical protein
MYGLPVSNPRELALFRMVLALFVGRQRLIEIR